jgi:hypothetical protein
MVVGNIEGSTANSMMSLHRWYMDEYPVIAGSRAARRFTKKYIYFYS